jgi:hypothetical protein
MDYDLTQAMKHERAIEVKRLRQAARTGMTGRNNSEGSAAWLAPETGGAGSNLAASAYEIFGASYNTDAELHENLRDEGFRGACPRSIVCGSWIGGMGMNESGRLFAAIFFVSILELTTARANVIVSAGATQNMDCADNVCVPTAEDGVLNATDLETMLANGNVDVATTGSGVQANNIEIDAPMAWSSGSVLTLDAMNRCEWKSVWPCPVLADCPL